MGVINTTGKNIALDAIGSACTHMALYSDVAGTVEITGGSYTRQAIAWSSAAAGSKAITGTETFNIPAGATVRAIGVVTASTGGVQHAVDDVTAETFASAGTYTVTAFTMSIT